ncbi:hypothetical protein J7L48_00195 [bacterium]|nr:hypothetical protein [bacterium]
MINKNKANNIISEFLESLEEKELLKYAKFIFSFGSVTLDVRYIPNINIGIVADNIDGNILRRFRSVIKKVMRKSRSMPLFLTKDEFEKYTNYFPIEYYHMKFRHNKLYGKDLFTDLDIKIDDLLPTIKREFAAKILKLREIYFATSGKFILKRVLFKSISSLVTFLKLIIYIDYRTNKDKFKKIFENNYNEQKFMQKINGIEIFEFVNVYYKLNINYLMSVYKYKYNNIRVDISPDDFFKGIEEWKRIQQFIELKM